VCLRVCVAGFFFASRIRRAPSGRRSGLCLRSCAVANGASLGTHDGGPADVEKILLNTPGWKHISCFVASVCSVLFAPVTLDLFCDLQALERAQERAEQFQSLKAHLNQQFEQVATAVAFGFSRPPFQASHCGRIYIHARRPFGHDIQFLAKTWVFFLKLPKKRPEIGTLSTTFLASVPQDLSK